MRTCSAGKLVRALLAGGIAVFSLLHPASPAAAQSLVPGSSGLPDASTIEQDAAVPNLSLREASPFLVQYSTPLALSPHDHFFFNWPLEKPAAFTAASDYRFGAISLFSDSLHTGLDIKAEMNDPVLAAAEGEVIFSGKGLVNGSKPDEDPYGIVVLIQHSSDYDGNAVYTLYAHLSKTLVKRGDLVSGGQQIGNIGVTGATSGPHLHFELRIDNGTYVRVKNPELWITPPVGYGVLAGRIENSYGYLLAKWPVMLKNLETGQQWTIKTYDIQVLYDHLYDPYFQETFVLNDLPGGKYEISTWYNYLLYTDTIEIIPGTINYFYFLGNQGFQKDIPPGGAETDFLN